MPSPLPALLRLPKKRRLEIAEELSVADEEKMPVPVAHRAILDKRLAEYRAGKSKAITIEELMRRVRAQ